MKNKISNTLSSEEFDAFLNDLNSFESQLPFLINLSEDDRQGGFRLGDKNLGFLTKSKDYINQKPEFMPNYVDINEVAKDTTLAEQLFALHRKIMVLADKIEDTANIAGIEALSGALAYYNSVKVASKNNATGAQTIYDDLKTRFPGRGKSNNE